MIHRRSDTELDKMHQANAIVLRTLELMKDALAPGITTADLDQIAERELRREGARPAFKGYRGFPANVCISVNEEVVHGIPSRNRVLRDGDIVSMDFGCAVDGYYGDNAVTAPVGQIPGHLERLLEVTEKALFQGIEAARPGSRVSDISYAIQSFVEARGFAVVREFVGHGIGRALHEDPPVPNFVRAGRDPKLLAGMCLAIEPMVNSGEHHVKTLKDRWTVVTADGSFAAHFERSVAILESGPWILAEPRAIFEGAKVG